MILSTAPRVKQMLGGRGKAWMSIVTPVPKEILASPANAPKLDSMVMKITTLVEKIPSIVMNMCLAQTARSCQVTVVHLVQVAQTVLFTDLLWNQARRRFTDLVRRQNTRCADFTGKWRLATLRLTNWACQHTQEQHVPPELCDQKVSTNKAFFSKNTEIFLDAFSHLYKRVCPSVRPSVRPSVTHELKSCLSAVFDRNWDK